ncbi:hypothetical protein K525DRAFT_271632 [Schizophyllum commune Loenen D]|nr:hypothetical protein K525DRAFT_271632 [Schizophyllum commune Loenen D]
MLTSKERTMLSRCVKTPAKALSAAIVHRGATARSYESGNPTRCNSSQLLASVSYSTSTISAPSDMFSTKLVKPVHFANGATSYARIRANHQLAQRVGLAVRRDIRSQRARRLRGELQAEHTEALDRALTPALHEPPTYAALCPPMVRSRSAAELARRYAAEGEQGAKTAAGPPAEWQSARAGMNWDMPAPPLSLVSHESVGLERVGQHYVHASAPASSFFLSLEDKLVTESSSSDASDTDHVNCALLPSWLSPVLGDDWAPRFDDVNASDGCARAFFLPAAPDPSKSIRVGVSVHTVAADGGYVDVERSTAAAAMDRVIDILGSIDRDPETLWVRGELDEFGDWSPQYGADIGAGRILVGAGNTVVDFAGMASTAALEEHMRRLLHHIVRRDAPPLRMPVLRNRLVSSGLVHDAGDPQEFQAVAMQVEGVGTRFVQYFEVDGLFATAGVTCESGAPLLGKYTIERGRLSLQVTRIATNPLAASPPLALEGAGYAPWPLCIASALSVSICTS